MAFATALSPWLVKWWLFDTNIWDGDPKAMDPWQRSVETDSCDKSFQAIMTSVETNSCDKSFQTQWYRNIQGNIDDFIGI
jgi:hypothetical protein